MASNTAIEIDKSKIIKIDKEKVKLDTTAQKAKKDAEDLTQKTPANPKTV